MAQYDRVGNRTGINNGLDEIRLDEPVTGVLLFGRNSKATGRVAKQFRERETKKTYWALVKGVPKKREDKISTWLVKEQVRGADEGGHR